MARTLSQQRYVDRNRNLIAARARERYHAVKREIFVALGSICARCGFADHRAIEVDHIDDDGHAHRLSQPGRSVYRAILVDIQAGTGRYQLLCSNCHLIKTYHER